MPASLLLITGVFGFVGFVVFFVALRAGHTVRAAVRSEATAAAARARPAIQALNPGSRLSFVLVRDITAPWAFDDAAEGASHIIHIASPLVTGDRVPPAQQTAYFIRPAVQGTLGLLEAAHRAGTVRRVVIPSSIVALVPVAEMEGTAPRRQRPVRPAARVPLPGVPFVSVFVGVGASLAVVLVVAGGW